MQITPMPGASWSNAAAAQQATTDQRAGTNTANSAAAAAKPGIGDVERSAETLDRDANGQYTPGQSGRNPDAENPDEEKKEGYSILDLPAIGQPSELDLMG
jgi:hypothetical protein